MSLMPFSPLLCPRNYYPWEMMRPSRRWSWDNFGLGITPPEIQRLSELSFNFASNQRKEFADAIKKCADIVPHVGKDGFQVSMDIEHFQPNEITVKTIDNTIIVEGKHEERDDEHGQISRQFVRKYTLPIDYDPNEVHSTLSSDGFLTVKAPPPSVKNVDAKERIIQIQHTGPAHLHVKTNVNVDEVDEGNKTIDDKDKIT